MHFPNFVVRSISSSLVHSFTPTMLLPPTSFIAILPFACMRLKSSKLFFLILPSAVAKTRKSLSSFIFISGKTRMLESLSFSLRFNRFTIALPFAGIFLAVFTLPMLLFGLWLIDKFSLGDISSYFLLVFFLLLSIPLGVPFALFGASAILYFWNKEKYLENLSNQQNTKLNKWLYKKLTK